MSQKIKKGLLLIMSIVMLAPAVRGLAATPKQEALKAYSRWLSNANVQVMPKNEDIYLLDGWTKYTRPTPASKTLFAIAYINNDSIPELIVCNDNKEFYSVLTYRNGKIVRASSCGELTTLRGYYSKTGVYMDSKSVRFSPFKTMYYVMGTNSTSHRFEVDAYEDAATRYYYFTKNRVMTSLANRTMFKSKLETFTKGKALTPVKYYRNTAANRKNILK